MGSGNEIWVLAAGYIVNGDTINGNKYGEILMFCGFNEGADTSIKIGAVLFPHE